MKSVMVLWLYSAEQYSRTTPVAEIAEHAALHRFNDEPVDVLCLHGYQFVPPSEVERLAERNFHLRDVSPVFREIAARYPNLRARYPNHFFECFLRWIVVRTVCDRQPLLVWDADIFFNEKLSVLHEALAGSTFTASSTCFVALSDPRWLDVYSEELAALEQDAAGYCNALHADLVRLQRENLVGFRDTFFGPIITTALDSREKWSRLFADTPEEMFVDGLVRRGRLPHHLVRPPDGYWFCPQPLLLPRLGWHHPFGAGLPSECGAADEAAGFACVEGRYHYRGRPLAFLHFQGAVSRAATAHLIQTRFLQEDYPLFDELYCPPALRRGRAVQADFFARKADIQARLESLPDYPALVARWGNPYSERVGARHFLLTGDLTEVIRAACPNANALSPSTRARSSAARAAREVSGEPICLVCCYLPFESTGRASWLRLHEELSSRGLQLVMLSRHAAPDLPFPVFQVPLALADYPGSFPVAATVAGVEGDSRAAAWVENDVVRWGGRHPIGATRHGLAVAKLVLGTFLDRLLPACVLTWDDGPALSACLKQLCLERGLPVQVLERGLLPGTLMVERVGMAGFSDMRHSWLADIRDPDAEDEALVLRARNYYREKKPQKYAQPAFGSGAAALRAHLDLGANKVVVFFGHVDPGVSGPMDSVLGRTANPAFPSTLAALAGMAAAVALRSDTVLLFKPHPADHTDYDAQSLPGVRIIKEANIHALIELADAIAVLFTTIQYEVAFYDKPIVTLARSPWWGRDATYEVNHAAQVDAVLEAALAGRDWPRKSARARACLAWLLRRFLIAWEPGVPASRGIPEFADFLQRCAGDAAHLPPADSRVRDAIRILRCLGRDYGAEIPALSGENATLLADQVTAAQRTKGQPDQVAVWEVQLGGNGSRALFLHPPACMVFAVPTGCCGRLTTAIALHPDMWGNVRSGSCEFSVRIDGRVAFAMAIDPLKIPGDRRWHEVVLDVPVSHTGRHQIAFETRGVGSDSYRWALWREPRFAWAESAPLSVSPALSAPAPAPAT